MIDRLSFEETLPASFLRSIDEICDRFESELQAGREGDIRGYVAPLADAHPACKLELLRQLIVLDLESAWRRGTGANNGTASIGRVEDYWLRFPELQELPRESHLDLIATEFRARQTWGDRPTVEEFAKRFGTLSGDDLRRTLYAVLAELTPTLVKVYENRALRWATELVAPLEFGRQQGDEGGPYRKVPMGARDRLVVAAAHEKRISRRQLLVAFGSRGTLAVSNPSRTNAVVVQSRGQLVPGQTVLLDAPVVITLGNRAVRLERS